MRDPSSPQHHEYLPTRRETGSDGIQAAVGARAERPSGDAPEEEAGLDVLLFTCAGVPCAVPLTALREVQPSLPRTVALPHSPPWMLGVFPHHTEMIGLADPSPLLLGRPADAEYVPHLAARGVRLTGTPMQNPPLLCMALLIGDGTRSLALAVNAIGAIVRARAEDLVSSVYLLEEVGIHIVARYVAGAFMPRGSSERYAALRIDLLLDDLLGALDDEEARLHE